MKSTLKLKVSEGAKRFWKTEWLAFKGREDWMKLESEKRNVRKRYVSIGAYASDVRFFKTLKLNSRFDADEASSVAS